MSTNTVFLVNPASQNGATGKRWPELAHRAAHLGLRGDTRFSERPGHLIELAREASRDAELLVVVGGDGTLNEVVNGVLTAGGATPELAILSNGTGQDFVRTHGIPPKLDDAVEVALRGATRTVDAGRVTYAPWGGGRDVRYFANVASVGMSGAVAQRANSMSKALGGRATFFYALARVFLAWDNCEVVVDLDNERRSGLMHDVVVANGQYHGGAMWLAPDARPDDGLFDVVLFGDISKADFLTTAPKLYKGKHLAHAKVEVLRSTTVRVETPEPLPIELDGEQVGTTPVSFEVVPKALRVRVPRASGEGSSSSAT